MKLTLSLLLSALALANALAKIGYVDNNSPGGNDGASWATAWDSLGQIGGMGAGDTVYVSGGPSGGSKIYVMGSWNPPDGNETAQFTLAIGKEQGHNGTATFKSNNTAPEWLQFCHYVTVNGRLDNTNHFRVEGYGLIVYADSPTAWSSTEGSKGVKVLGIDSPTSQVRMYDSRKTELGWIRFGPHKLTGGPGWIIGVGRGDQTGWGQPGRNSIHDCEFNLFYLHGVDSDGDNGDDAIQNPGSIDIYRNKFISRKTTGWAGDNHQDGIQTDGMYVAIFDNYFENLSNYCIFLEFWGGAHRGARIYNNVFNYSDPVLRGQPSQAIAIDVRNANNTFSDFQIFNNTFLGGNQALSWSANPTSGPGIDNTCHVVNNLTMAGSGGLNIHVPSSQAVVTNNVQGVPAGYFVNAAAGNFRLTSAATGAIDKGTSAFVSTVTTKDAEGASRPVNANWDVGAYEYGGTVPPPTPTPVPTPTPKPLALGDRIELTAQDGTNIRSAPVIDPANLLGEQPMGATGTLVEGPSVSNDGVVWWKTNFDTGVDGWAGENNMTASTKPPPPSPSPSPTPTPTPEPSPSPLPPGKYEVKGVLEIMPAEEHK